MTKYQLSRLVLVLHISEVRELNWTDECFRLNSFFDAKKIPMFVILLVDLLDVFTQFYQTKRNQNDYELGSLHT